MFKILLSVFIGTNLWYGAILGSTGQGGDRQRLNQELDTLQALGITNLRVLVGAEGKDGFATKISPTLLLSPGVYNDTLLDGLDYLLWQLGERQMQAVLYLNNAWEWSGGYEQYHSWATGELPMVPAEVGYPLYMQTAGRFFMNDRAVSLFDQHVRYILTRTNRYTSRPYTDDPAIYAWEIANEPRAFGDANKGAFLEWIRHEAMLFKSLDSNHLLTTGSEGIWGCEMDADLCREIHAIPEIDYMTCHIWPYNWGWLRDSDDTWIEKVQHYVYQHDSIADLIGKPFIIEEFGFPRDAMALTPGTPTTQRNRFYKLLIDDMRSGRFPHLQGLNCWGWGGYAQPQHRSWQPSDDYCGDPAQEDQGLNSVFICDSTTICILRSNPIFVP